MIQSLKQSSQKQEVLCHKIENSFDVFYAEFAILYLGNLSEKCTEMTIAKSFSRFGVIVSIKMIPARAEQEKHKNMSAFLRFDTFAAAYLAKTGMHETKILEQNVKVVWSKNLIPIAL